MSIFLIKSILALVFLAAGAVAVLAMFSLMGISEHKASPLTLRRLHRAMGFIFVLLLIVISVLCVRYVARVGDQVSLRGALHCVFALALIAVLAVKITIIKWFKGLLNLVPVMGIIVFVLAFVVVGTSAGFFFLRGAASGGAAGAAGEDTAGAGAGGLARGDLERGRTVFEAECTSCHAADNAESGFAPGLKGLFENDSLPHSGRPATVENVISQLREPVGMMPSYNSLAERDLADLIEYLKTL